jgi:hypothetical protein
MGAPAAFTNKRNRFALTEFAAGRERDGHSKQQSLKSHGIDHDHGVG